MARARPRTTSRGTMDVSSDRQISLSGHAGTLSMAGAGTVELRSMELPDGMHVAGGVQLIDAALHVGEAELHAAHGAERVLGRPSLFRHRMHGGGPC